MKLGIDLDNVVVDLQKACADEFGYAVEDALDWDDVIKLAGCTTETEWLEALKDIGAFQNAKPVAGAVSSILRLATVESNHEIHFITARPEWATASTLDWLHNYFRERTLAVQCKYQVHILSNGESKSTVPCDLYLDDSPHVLSDLMDHACLVVRYWRPWNKTANYDFSVQNWDEFVTLVAKLEAMEHPTPPSSNTVDHGGKQYFLPGPRVHATMANRDPIEIEVPDANQGVTYTGGFAFPTMVEELEPWCYDNGDRIPTDDMYDGERTEEWRRAIVWNDERRVTDPVTGGQKTADEWIIGPPVALQETRIVDPVTGGAKGQKNQQASLLPWDALMKVSEHYAAGADKYSRDNWQKGYAWHLTFDALQRHLAAWWQGEDEDDEGLEHLNAVVFHALALRTFTLRGIGTDDRPSRG